MMRKQEQKNASLHESLTKSRDFKAIEGRRLDRNSSAVGLLLGWPAARREGRWNGEKVALLEAVLGDSHSGLIDT